MVDRAEADIEVSGQPVHLHTLIRFFIIWLQSLAAVEYIAPEGGNHIVFSLFTITWVLIRSTLLIYFKWVLTCFCGEIWKRKIPVHFIWKNIKPYLKLWEYSRTLMAKTSFGPWQFVREVGSSSHWGLIMAPGQEADSDNLEKSSIFYRIIVCLYSLELPRGNSNEYTQHTILIK